MKMNTIDWLACILAIAGALNWGLIGFINFDLVSAIFGDMSLLSRVLYSVIGVSGLWMIYAALRCCKACNSKTS